ncbi:gamma-type small acid-soluble spore protein [Bacillus sp. T3]|uniref:gamma-type small acid-soluble spore protein n=1 Tax=Bacillus sp. T3 TaxID=467262 RepID=UPI0029819DA5|nr:gamma-type small acid-soluble spore protein [Bacillus sp. T3]
MNQNNNDNYTVVGTDIEEVKKLNAQSGLSYNEAKEVLARMTGGHGTAMYGNTDEEEVRGKNER